MIINTLKIFGMGMLAIFLVMAVLFLAVKSLNKLTNLKKKPTDDEKNVSNDDEQNNSNE